MLLNTLLIEASRSARAFHSDSYAWKLAFTSSSRLRCDVSITLRCTKNAVTANRTVSASEVDSRIFQSNDSRTNLISSPPDTSTARQELEGTLFQTCCCGASVHSPFRKS